MIGGTLYDGYQLRCEMLAPLRHFAEEVQRAALVLPPSLRANPVVRSASAWAEVMQFAGLRHERPNFDITRVAVDGRSVAVNERVVATDTFGSLLHFEKETTIAQPRVLLIAPLAGHYATLLRDTVFTMLADHDVFVTDWHNARDIAVTRGSFGVDDYIQYLIAFQHCVGPSGHTVAVCQPCPLALAATALMAADGDPCTPLSLTLMAGPVDTAVNPGAVRRLTGEYPLEWFARNMIVPVPAGHRGAGRLVRPGFLQLSAFMAMNLERHAQSFQRLFFDRMAGEDAAAERTSAFYSEYLAVLDMTAEFFLETVKRIFQCRELAVGAFEWRGRPVDLAEITDTTLLTIEGD